MKTLVIGDTHGLTIWKGLVEQYKGIEKVIFLGDYVDSFTISDSQIIKNLDDIIEYKRANPEKVELLLGNHDIQYIFKGNNCSGRRESYAIPIYNLFWLNLDLFKIMHQEGDYLFSHAGITQDWLDANEEILSDLGKTYEESVNNMFRTRHRDKIFQCGPARGGHHKASGPLWADKTETTSVKLNHNIMQVVGHTPVKHVTSYANIIYCDTLEHGDKKPLILHIKDRVNETENNNKEDDIL